MMKITKQHVQNLLKLLTGGIIHGAGYEDGRFCVQQAVHRATTGDPEMFHNDQPRNCVSEFLIQFGIRLNDFSHSMTNTQRAKMLQRYAIAELGSLDIDINDFRKRLSDRTGTNLDYDYDPGSIIEDYVSYYPEHGITTLQKLTKLANAAADVLKEMGTQGGEYLYLIDEPDKEKKERDARKLATKHYAAQMANFGMTSCAIKPTQKQ